MDSDGLAVGEGVGFVPGSNEIGSELVLAGAIGNSYLV